jgi:hypothetical protein
MIDARGGMIMAYHGWPTTAEIGEVFAEEVAEIGGTVTDRFDDGTRLLARSVLPGLREVGRNDRVQGGVAIRATGEEICVHPYLFRQVCRNGAIMAQAIQTWQIARDDDPCLVGEAPLGTLREAIRASGSEEAFWTSAEQMRSAREVQADLALTILPMLGRMPKEMVNQLLGSIMDRFARERDNSSFGLMNAVTSVARDTRDPELRWRLEELGGGIPAAIARPGPTPRPARAKLATARA